MPLLFGPVIKMMQRSLLGARFRGLFPMVMGCYIGLQFPIIERVERAVEAPDTCMESDL